MSEPIIPVPEVKPIIPDPLIEIKNKLTADEKESFFKAFLADKPFIATESLFDGKLEVKFASLNVKQNNSIMLQMQFDREHDIAKNSDKYLIQVIQYRIASSLLELDHKPFAVNVTEKEYPTDAKEGTTFLLKRLDLMQEWGVYKISAVTEAFNRFERKLRALTEESFKTPF